MLLSRVVRGSMGARALSSCPLSYRYSPADLAASTTPEISVANVVFVVGGLYGNIEALEAVEARAAAEFEAKIIFNGDFNFFNASAKDWDTINSTVRRHHAIVGNVEAEASDPASLGCGCAYPPYVSGAFSARSDAIVARLRAVAQAGDPEILAWLRGLPKLLHVCVGKGRVGVLHGDPRSLSGWGFSVEAMEPPDTALRASLGLRTGDNFTPTTEAAVGAYLEEAKVDVFACTHTCLPFAQRYHRGIVVNNGSAGMPNFSVQGADRFGIMTRIAWTETQQAAPFDSIYGTSLPLAASNFRSETQNGYLRIDAVPVRYDQRAWSQRFASLWPAGSPAAESYAGRIERGPAFTVAQAARLGVELK